MPGQLGYRKAVAKTELSNSLVTEGDLGELWSRVCAALEENAPASALPAPARDMAGEIISCPAEKKTLPAASPHTLESTVASAKTTGTKSSPWSIAVAASKQDGCPGPPQFTDFPEATSVDFTTPPGFSNSVDGERLSPSMVDAAVLRKKLETLVDSKRRPSKDVYPPLVAASPGLSLLSSRRGSRNNIQLQDLGSESNGLATPLSVHSVTVTCPSAPFTASFEPEQPSPSKLPWLQLGGPEFSMPSVRALEACAGDATERPVGSRSGQSTCRSKSSAGLPPLPGSNGDSKAMQHTLRHLAKSSVIRAGRGRHEHDSGRVQPVVQPHRWNSALGRRKNQCWEAGQERKEDLAAARRSLSQSLPPKKRSRLKRMLSRLWWFGSSENRTV